MTPDDPPLWRVLAASVGVPTLGAILVRAAVSLALWAGADVVEHSATLVAAPLGVAAFLWCAAVRPARVEAAAAALSATTVTAAWKALELGPSLGDALILVPFAFVTMVPPLLVACGTGSAFGVVLSRLRGA